MMLPSGAASDDLDRGAVRLGATAAPPPGPGRARPPPRARVPPARRRERGGEVLLRKVGALEPHVDDVDAEIASLNYREASRIRFIRPTRSAESPPPSAPRRAPRGRWRFRIALEALGGGLHPADTDRPAELRRTSGIRQRTNARRSAAGRQRRHLEARVSRPEAPNRSRRNHPGRTGPEGEAGFLVDGADLAELQHRSPSRARRRWRWAISRKPNTATADE